MTESTHPRTGAHARAPSTVERRIAPPRSARPRRGRASVVALLIGALGVAATASAGDRLTGTGGVSQVEGAGGGGLVPWALVTGLATREQTGGSAHATFARVGDGFELQSTGAALGLGNRLELSIARLRFGLGEVVPGESVRMDVLGAKLRLWGDAVYDQDRPWPQVAVGLQHKRSLDFAGVPAALGATRASGTDLYVAATKVWLGALAGRNLLASVALRRTDANQLGLLGFGGPSSGGASWRPEASAAVFLTDRVAIGGEWRERPDNLPASREERASSLFAAWFPLPYLSLTAARVDLGNIADRPRQAGWYVSVQLVH